MTVTRSAVLKSVVALAIVGVLVGGLTLVVALPSVKDLEAARDVLSGSATDLTRADVARADEYLERVADRLGGFPANVLGVVPVVGPSLGAMRAVAEAARPVLASGLDLKERVDELRSEGLLAGGRIRIDALEDLRAPLVDELDALGGLGDTALEHRNGWIAPPVWDALDDIARRTAELRADADDFEGLLGSLRGILGVDEPRRYLVMLLNNAELRGAGGVVTGLGTISIRDGRLGLGRFYPYESLRREPFETVPSPGDFERRYAQYGANTTIFINSTYSPDVPDDALVAARLFEKVTGVATDGALVADPRGLAALLPPDDRLQVPGRSLEVSPEELPRFIYSDAYEVYESNVERRAAILRLGAAAFEDVVHSGSSDESITDAAGEAFAGGHLRFVSFDDDEQALLDRLDVGGDVEPEPGDSLLVAAQNWGGGIPGQGSKMDYWVQRDLKHECEVDPIGSARCVDEVTLRNIAPRGLITYVAGRPYAMVRNNVETYLPGDAEVEVVRVDGGDKDFATEEDEGHKVVQVYVSVPRDRQRTIAIQYALPPNDDGYSFRAVPQPLARDASIEVALALPADWAVDGPGAADDHGVWRYEDAFVRTFELEATPDQRSGIPGIWDSLADFWTQPVFG